MIQHLLMHLSVQVIPIILEKGDYHCVDEASQIKEKKIMFSSVSTHGANRISSSISGKEVQKAWPTSLDQR
jgi:hypothetical protein